MISQLIKFSIEYTASRIWINYESEMCTWTIFDHNYNNSLCIIMHTCTSTINVRALYLHTYIQSMHESYVKS